MPMKYRIITDSRGNLLGVDLVNPTAADIKDLRAALNKAGIKITATLKFEEESSQKGQEKNIFRVNLNVKGDEADAIHGMFYKFKATSQGKIIADDVRHPTTKKRF